MPVYGFCHAHRVGDVMNNTIKHSAFVVFSGLLFGMGMVISGMADPAKVIGFLNITGVSTGTWDLSLAFVMGGALAVFIPVYQLAIKPRTKAVLGGDIITPPTQVIDARLITGAITFGLGWGLLGVCPGPAIASTLVGNMQAWLFLGALLIGSFTAKTIP